MMQEYYKLSERSKLSQVAVLLNKEDVTNTPKEKLPYKVYTLLSDKAEESYKVGDKGSYIAEVFDPETEEYTKVSVNLKPIDNYKIKSEYSKLENNDYSGDLD